MEQLPLTKNIKRLLKNYINTFDHKIESELGSLLCDVDEYGITISLSSDDCFKLGKALLKNAYYRQPAIQSALALQYACLFRDNDYDSVIEMKNTAISLNNWQVLNNIAYALFKKGLASEAEALQKICVNLSDHQLAQYNLFVYKLKNGSNVNDTAKIQKYLEMLINNEIGDYESALLLAAYYDNDSFFKNNIAYFNKYYKTDDKITRIMNGYLLNKAKPSLNQLLELIEPHDIYNE